MDIEFCASNNTKSTHLQMIQTQHRLMRMRKSSSQCMLMHIVFLCFSASAAIIIITFRKLAKPNANYSVKEKTLFCAFIAARPLETNDILIPPLLLLLNAVSNLVLKFTFRKCTCTMYMCVWLLPSITLAAAATRIIPIVSRTKLHFHMKLHGQTAMLLKHI